MGRLEGFHADLPFLGNVRLAVENCLAVQVGIVLELGLEEQPGRRHSSMASVLEGALG